MINDVVNSRMQAILDQDKSLENDLAMINNMRETLNNENNKGEDDNMVEVTAANMAPTTVSDKVEVRVSQVEVKEPPFVDPTPVTQVTITNPNVNTVPTVQEVIQQPIPQMVEPASVTYNIPVQTIPVNNPTPVQAVINQPQVQP